MNIIEHIFTREVWRMAMIFNDESREKMRIQLLETGFASIKLHGLKKTSVTDVANSAGIAAGTFYKFFDSKEEFVYQIVVYKRGRIKEYFRELSENGRLDKEAFRKFLTEVTLEDNNLFDHLDEREMKMLMARWPVEYWKNDSNDEMTAEWLLKSLDGVRRDINMKVFVNLFKSLSLIRYGRSKMYEEQYEETIGIYIDAIIRYVFGE